MADKHTPFRMETDSLGGVQVPQNALYGAQTQRAVNNFAISGLTMPRAFIQALARIKAAAARANGELGLLDTEVTDAIVAACGEILAGKHEDQFPVDVFQTGSGTSSNMNINEVLAHLASERLGEAVHPNDQVNLGQSSNDVIPTAIHVSAALELYNQLVPALEDLHTSLLAKSMQLEGIVKTGRTHLMDAMPLRLDQ